MSPELPPPLDEGAWEEAATTYAIASLERQQASAEKWVGAISTLMGLFGTVVVVAGPEALSDLDEGRVRYGVFVALALAGVLAFVAVILAALVAQASTRLWDNWSGTTFAAYIAQNSASAAARLTVSRWLGATAAFIVLGTGLFATWASLG